MKRNGELSAGLQVRLGGTADRLAESWQAMQFNLLLALAITYLLMAGLFESWVYPLVIILTVPLAAVGGFACLWLTNQFTEQPLDIITMLGFVILIGTAVNNAILIVHQSIHLIAEGSLSSSEAVVESVRNRIRPIFMTTGTTVLGLFPLVVMPGAGSELYRGTWQRRPGRSGRVHNADAVAGPGILQSGDGRPPAAVSKTGQTVGSSRFPERTPSFRRRTFRHQVFQLPGESIMVTRPESSRPDFSDLNNCRLNTCRLDCRDGLAAVPVSQPIADIALFKRAMTNTRLIVLCVSACSVCVIGCNSATPDASLRKAASVPAPVRCGRLWWDNPV